MSFLNREEYDFFNRQNIKNIEEGEGISIDWSNPNRPKISASGGSGGGAWGEITGNIEDQADLVNYIAENGGSVELGGGLHFDEDGKVVLGTVDSDESSLITLPFKLTSKPLFEGIDEVEASFHILPDPNSSLPIFLTNLQAAISQGVVVNAYNQLSFGSSLTHIGDLSDPLKYVSLEVATQPNPEGVTGVIITDVAFEKGAIYAADYSTNFTDRSLVDKGYVDNAVSNITSNLTFENGLREDDGVVKLGLDVSTLGTTNEGILTEPLYLLQGDVLTSKYSSLRVDYESLLVELNSFNSEGAGSRISVGGSSSLNIARSFSPTSQISIELSNSVTITDTFSNLGAVYTQDYSANGKLNDRWIPDWGAVKNYVDENGGSVELGQGLHFDNEGKVALGSTTDESTFLNTPFILRNITPFEGTVFGINAYLRIDELESIPFISLSSETSIDTIGTLKSGLDISLRGTRLTNSNFTTGEGVFEISLSGGSNGWLEGIVITDTSLERGVVYASDYSANFTDRSLVDKAYVDSVAGEIELGSGLRLDGDGKVALGSIGSNTEGNITSTMTLRYGTDTQGTNFVINQYSSYIRSILGNDTGSINIGPTDSSLKSRNSSGIEVSLSLSSASNKSFVLRDDKNNKGASYHADYSTNFDERSLVDKGYTDTLVSSRLSAAQRTAINALVSPTEDYADMTEATAAIKSIIDALQAV